MKLNLSKEWFKRRISVSDEMEADNVDELIEAMKEGFAVRLSDVEGVAERYRQALTRLVCYAATVESENTREWMDGLVAHLNDSCVTLNEPTVFVLHRSNADGSMWITKRDIP